VIERLYKVLIYSCCFFLFTLAFGFSLCLLALKDRFLGRRSELGADVRELLNLRLLTHLVPAVNAVKREALTCNVKQSK